MKFTYKYDFTDAMFIKRRTNLGFHLDENNNYLVAGIIDSYNEKVSIALLLGDTVALQQIFLMLHY